MNDLVFLIKRAALDAVEAEKPVMISFGTAEINNNQLFVVVEQRMRLFGEMLIIPKGLEIENNDSVVLLREQGGQRFVVLGVV